MLHPYNYKKQDGLSYEFITNKSVRYIVYFIVYDYCSSATDGCSNGAYQFGFQKIGDGDSDETIIFDPRIRVTIECILKEFFNNHENVILYICYPGDKKHSARKRLFDNWFNESGKLNGLEKCNAEFKTEGDTYYTSMILKTSNPLFKEYVTSFNNEVEYLQNVK